MPNTLTSTGLTTATEQELVAQYTAAFQAIYGSDINLGAETPDGQIMMTFIQSVLDVEDLITLVYTSFDPDQAFGVILDQRVAINGIQRQAGTYTVTNITITTTNSVNLYGLDQSVNPIYTVSDNAGNQWQLQATQLGFSAPSGISLAFQASTPGALTTIPNTITTPVTIVLGVSAINNPTTYTTLGLNEESDAALKIRRQISVSLASQGYLAGLLAALENISGVTYAFVEENTGGTTNADGVPGHSIWVIIGGSGAAADIANAIYTKRNAGCGMYNTGDSGAQSYTITQVDGSLFTVYWEDVVTVPLFIKFTASSLNGTTPSNYAAILNATTGLPGLFQPGPAAEVNINELSTYVQQIDPNTLVTSSGFSTSAGGSYTNTLSPVTKNQRFITSAADTIILPIYITAPGASVTVISNVVTSTLAITGSGVPVSLTANGGYQVGVSTPWSFTLHGSSGSTLNTSTGAYVSGSAGTDTIKYTDSLSNISNIITITVS